ncbi:Protein of unknown function [Gryllus bimaculatus]|nr:Protein of unknown function [Gryllus bimaculatus]
MDDADDDCVAEVSTILSWSSSGLRAGHPDSPDHAHDSGRGSLRLHVCGELEMNVCVRAQGACTRASCTRRAPSGATRVTRGRAHRVGAAVLHALPRALLPHLRRARCLACVLCNKSLNEKRFKYFAVPLFRLPFCGLLRGEITICMQFTL